MLPARLGFRRSHLGELWVGVGDPGQRGIVDLGGQTEQGVADHDAGLIAGDMREMRPVDNVADRIDAARGGAQPPVDDDALSVVLDAGAVEIEALDPGLAAGGDQQMRSGDLKLPSRLPRRSALCRFRSARPTVILVCWWTATPSSVKTSSSAPASSGSSLRQSLRRLDDRHRGAEPPVGLRQLDADRTGADHQEMLRQRRVVENRLVGEIGDAVDAGDRRDRRLGAGGDDHPPRLDRAIAGNNPAPADETCFGADHLDPETLEPLDQIIAARSRR